MEVYEITGFRTGLARDGVNFLEPGESFQEIVNGFVFRQILQSRRGIAYFAPRLADKSRVFGIFEHILPDSKRELLVADQNFLYKYDPGTATFNQIPFGGSMGGYAGFNIPSKDFYISGVSYSVAQFLSNGMVNPEYDAATRGARFIFCGEGIDPNANDSSIFFYDGTNVLDFTDIGDNPNYAPPIEGPLTNARYVVFFHTRLNFLVTTIDTVKNYQNLLYSAFKDVSGNGDKFNVAGAGFLPIDSPDTIKGVSINGQILVINADRSQWTYEKLPDPFNPYFKRKATGVLGTDADFSSVIFDNQVKSMGKTGILTTDGRSSVRIDDKIPNFTQENIDQVAFNQTYGGFDRLNNQFLWSYKDASSESDTQDRVLVYNYQESSWAVFDYRVSVFGQTDLGKDRKWNEIEGSTEHPTWSQWNTTTDIWNRIGIELAVQKTLAGDDLGFIYQLDVDSDDYVAQITGISAVANLAEIIVSNPGIIVGDRVVVYNVQGMTEINNFDPEADTDPQFLAYEVLAISATTITINVDPTLFTAYTTGGQIAKIISFSAKTIPFNPYRDLGKRCYVSHVEFLIETNGGYLKVDVIADEEESPFKRDILILPSSTSTKSREWISMTVDNEANFHTFVLKQDSPNVQVKISSIRIHAEMGGMTNG